MEKTPVNNLFGAEAAKADKRLMLENMQNYAIQEEIPIKGKVSPLDRKHLIIRPFTNNLNGEGKYIGYLMPLLKKYNIVNEIDNSRYYVRLNYSNLFQIKQDLEFYFYFFVKSFVYAK